MVNEFFLSVNYYFWFIYIYMYIYACACYIQELIDTHWPPVRSFRWHLVSARIWAGWPKIVCLYEKIHTRFSLMSSSLPFQLCIVCLAHLTLIVCEMGVSGRTAAVFFFFFFFSGAYRICPKSMQHPCIVPIGK